MKLFTKEVNDKLFKQYPKGSDLDNQMVVAKIFNPYGRGRWFLLNSDPQDPDYIWAIVEMGTRNVEIGSVSRKELESIRVSPWRFPLERDLSFRPQNAKMIYEGLLEGKHFAHGGELGIAAQNKDMLLNYAEELEHHVEEFEEAAKKAEDVMPWVIAKTERASTDLSDVTHYLHSENEKRREYEYGEGEEKYADGGEVKWQDADYGDSALVISENKLGVIIKPYGRKFHLKFVDGTEKTYDANDLKFFKDIDDFDLGGEVNKEYNAMYFKEVIIRDGSKMDVMREREVFSGSLNSVLQKAMASFSPLDAYVRIADRQSGALIAKLTPDGKAKIYDKNAKVIDEVEVEQEVEEVEEKPKKKLFGFFKEGGEIPREQRKNKTFYHVIWDDGDSVKDEYFTDNKEASEKYYKLITSGEAKVAHLDKDSYNEYGWIEKHTNISRYPKSSFADGGMMAKGGIVLTKIEDIPNLENLIKEREVTYRGLGTGKLADDFYDLAGEGGKRIKVEGKEYFITDTDFDKISRGEDGLLRIRFAAPKRKSYDEGGMINRDLNIKVRQLAEKKGLVPQKLGRDYETNMAQAVVSALGDANFHSEAKKLVSALEKEPWSDDLYKSEYYNAEDEVDEFGREVANLSKWDGVDIANAFTYILRMNGEHRLAKMIDKAMEEDEQMAEGGWIDDVKRDMDEIQKKYPKSKVTYYFAKNGNGKNYVVEAKEDGKVVYTSYVSRMAEGGIASETPNDKFYKWYVDWLKSVNKYIYVSISIPNEFSSPIKDGKGKIVILDVIEKKGDTDAKKYMNEIVEKADEFGVSIYLQPIPRTHNLKSQEHKDKITKDYLIKYYQKFGFKNMDSGFMVREPKMAKGGKTEREYKVGDKVIYAPNGKFFGAKNISYIKKAEITDIEEISGKKVYTLEFKNKFGQIVNTLQTDNSREIDLDPDVKMAEGGKVKFSEKVKAIKKSLLERKKVSPKVQKDYGKTYSPKEAEESAKRIVGSMTAKERLKKKLSKGGSIRGRKLQDFKAPTLEEIRGWSDDKLTNLNWAYERVRQASGERKMVTKNWFKTLTKRVKQVREERGI